MSISQVLSQARVCGGLEKPIFGDKDLVTN
jgi:hypothetical protein